MTMNNSQMLKGILDGVILHVVSEEAVYGYDLVKKLRNRGFVDMTGGTVYPLVQKLEKNGYLRSEQLDSPEGPNRKYLFLTNKGEEFLLQFDNQWRHLSDLVEQIIK
jgi:PadR family transcriptional regulator PadR